MHSASCLYRQGCVRGMLNLVLRLPGLLGSAGRAFQVQQQDCAQYSKHFRLQAEQEW